VLLESELWAIRQPWQFLCSRPLGSDTAPVSWRAVEENSGDTVLAGATDARSRSARVTGMHIRSAIENGIAPLLATALKAAPSSAGACTSRALVLTHPRESWQLTQCLLNMRDLTSPHRFILRSSPPAFCVPTSRCHGPAHQTPPLRGHSQGFANRRTFFFAAV
jgi:hypothetical protein